MTIQEKPFAVVSDLEGCLIPEIWQKIAQKTGIDDLNKTTRDVPNYDELMRFRLAIIHEQGLRFSYIRDKIIANIRPLPGAAAFLLWLQSRAPVIILSDTFYQMVCPMVMQHLGFPTIFCHTLSIENDMIQNYHLRISDSKTQVVRSLQKDNGFRVIAIGDSYNDLGMLKAADYGYFLHAPENIQQQHLDLPTYENYEQLQEKLSIHLGD